MLVLTYSLAQNSPPGGPAMTTPRYKVHADVEESRLLRDNDQDTPRTRRRDIQGLGDLEF